ncbi:MAG: hypothetical protein V1875_07970 [Candidatus Altiarchaeota archaeon]
MKKIASLVALMILAGSAYALSAAGGGYRVDEFAGNIAGGYGNATYTLAYNSGGIASGGGYTAGIGLLGGTTPAASTTSTTTTSTSTTTTAASGGGGGHKPATTTNPPTTTRPPTTTSPPTTTMATTTTLATTTTMETTTTLATTTTMETTTTLSATTTLEPTTTLTATTIAPASTLIPPSTISPPTTEKGRISNKKDASGNEKGTDQKGPANAANQTTAEPVNAEIEVEMDDTRYLLPGGEIEYTAWVSSNMPVNGLVSWLDMESGFTKDQEQTISLEKDTPTRITWRISAKDDTNPGAYPIKLTIISPEGTIRTEKTSRVVVEKPVTVPILNIEAPPYSVVQDKAYSTIWKVSSVMFRYTYLIISLLILAVGAAYMVRRRMKNRPSRLSVAGLKEAVV